MINLLEETLEALERIGKTPLDVIGVVYDDNGRYSHWEEFAQKASDVYYDEGYGLQEIIPELKIVFRDGWLRRAEYDGAEWWQLENPPQMQFLVGEVPLLVRDLYFI